MLDSMLGPPAYALLVVPQVVGTPPVSLSVTLHTPPIPLPRPARSRLNNGAGGMILVSPGSTPMHPPVH